MSDWFFIPFTDYPATTIIHLHYNINKPLPGVSAADYNVDMQHKGSGGTTILYFFIYLFPYQTQPISIFNNLPTNNCEL